MIKIISTTLLTWCIAFSLFPYIATAEPKELVMVTGVDREETFLGRWLFLFYDEAFRRLGITMTFRTYPWKRCGILLDSEKVDGDLWRSPYYGEDHPDLVRVEEEGSVSSFCAWAVKPEIRNINGWDSLKGTDYKVDCIRGVKVTDARLPHVVKKENLSWVRDAENGFSKLVKGRSDIFVVIDSHAWDVLEKPEYRRVYMCGIMQTVPSHVYLLKKHADIAPKLGAVMKQMKAEGLLEKYRKEALGNRKQ